MNYFTDIVNSKQDMLKNFVYRLQNEDKADLHKCLLQQDKFCHVISPNELYAQWLDGAWCYVLVIDDAKICHAIIGRDELEDGEGDDIPNPKTIVLDTLGPKTIKGVINHAIKFNRKLVLIQLSNMPTIGEHQKHSYNVAWRYENAKNKRYERVRQIKLIKCIIETFAIADVHNEAEFRNALPVCAVTLAYHLSRAFKLDIQVDAIFITEYANEAPALYVEFRMPCFVNGKYNKYASVMPQTIGCRAISNEARPSFILKRCIIAMLQAFSCNVERDLQCTMNNLQSNLVRKDDKILCKYIPEQYQQVLCR